MLSAFPSTTTSFGSGSSIAYDVALAPHGKIVVAGEYGGKHALVRYNANGGLDTSFSGDGMIYTSQSFPYGDSSYAVAVQSDGKILVGGYITSNGNAPDFRIMRYNTDGSADSSFSTYTLALNLPVYAFDLAIQSDGKIVGVGTETTGPSTATVIVRLNSNGSPDSSFSGDGVDRRSFGTAPNWQAASALGVRMQGDGKIVVAGSLAGDFLAMRYNANGTLDTSFSGDGIATVDFGGSETAEDLALQSDGRIVLAGGNDSDMVLARLTTSGALDTSFGTSGKKTIDFNSAVDGATAVAIRSDGKIVVGGTAGGGANGDDFALLRLNSDGSLDATFDSDGKAEIDFAGSTDQGMGLALRESEGDAIVVGKATVGSQSRFGVVGFAEAATLPPPAPTDLFAQGVAQGKIKLQWTDASGGAASGFVIERQNSSGGWDVLNTVATTTYADTDPALLPDTRYTYRVKASNGQISAPSAEAAAATMPLLPELDDFEPNTEENWTPFVSANSSVSAALVSPGFSGDGAMQVNYTIGTGTSEWSGAGLYGTWEGSQDFSPWNAVTFWFQGQNTGRQMFLEIVDNHDPVTLVKEKFTTSFIDDSSSWEQITVPFTAFTRKTVQDPGAPDDGFTLTQVWGVNLFTWTDENGVGPGSGAFVLDEMFLTNLPEVTIAATDSQASEAGLETATFIVPAPAPRLIR